MPDTVARTVANTASTATSTPRQCDLLDTLNNPTRVSAADIRKAKKLLKLWYPMSYNLWMEHNG